MWKKEETEDDGKTKTILIIGISGFVGSNLAELLKDDYKVIGTYHKNRTTIPGVLTIPCDVLTKEEVQLVLFAFKPDITIYCAGISSVHDCAQHEDLADALNTSGLFNVVEYCQRYKSQICYLSSAYVFGGEHKNYIEMDIPDANTGYGKTQAAAEFYIQKTSLNYTIFRCCKLYGRGVNPVRPTWFENLQRKIKLSQQIMCDDYVKIGFLDITYLAMVLKMSFDKKAMNRLFQITTKDVSTYFEFARKYCEVFGESKNMVSKGKWHFPVLALPGMNIQEDLQYKLDIANIEGYLNISMPTIEESLQFTRKRLNGGKGKANRDKKGEGISFI